MLVLGRTARYLHQELLDVPSCPWQIWSLVGVSSVPIIPWDAQASCCTACLNHMLLLVRLKIQHRPCMPLEAGVRLADL